MWHEARRSEKKVHDVMDAARKRAQRRAVFLAKRRGDPHQSIQLGGSRCRLYRDDGLYQASEDQQGLIPWNGKQDVLIDRFDGRALLDFIRDTKNFSVQDKSEEEEELEEFVNFERYRDLIKHRRRGFTDDEGLLHVNQEMEARVTAPFVAERSQPQASAAKGSYSQVGFSYGGNGKDDSHSDADEDDEDEGDEDEDDFDSNDSGDEGMEKIAKEFGIKRYGWLVYMDKKAEEDEKRQKEVIKGDPAIRKMSRKERRKVSQIERERERETARFPGTRGFQHDPYRESRRSPNYEAYPRSRRSRSRSPSYSRHHSRGRHSDDHRSKPTTSKIEYITEFGGSGDKEESKRVGFSPPPSPSSQADVLNRSSTGLILEALHVDPASGASLDKDISTKVVKPSASASSALAKLSKTSTSGSLKLQPAEKKETPQERLKRIMSKQLNKQIKKDTAVEMAKKREQELQRLEKLAETSRLSSSRRRSHSRSYSPSPPRRHRRSKSPSRSRSSRRHYSHSRSHSHSRSPSRTHTRSCTYSRSPRARSRLRC